MVIGPLFLFFSSLHLKLKYLCHITYHNLYQNIIFFLFHSEFQSNMLIKKKSFVKINLEICKTVIFIFCYTNIILVDLNEFVYLFPNPSLLFFKHIFVY